VMCDMCGLEWTMMWYAGGKIDEPIVSCRFASETWNTIRAKVTAKVMPAGFALVNICVPQITLSVRSYLGP
jgi:hypothetical protein